MQQIVQKFFTRETTYSQLLHAVSENEEKLDHLRHENELVTEKLNELQMQDSDNQASPLNEAESSTAVTQTGRAANPEIH